MARTKPKPAPVEKAFDVFISHSSKDKSYADTIVKRLERAGLKCWIAPRDIIPGSNYGEAIVQGIEGSRLMVLIFSEHANESPQINREVERAVHNRIKIVPFRIQNVPLAKNLEYFISSPHWLDAFSGSLDENVAYLEKTVNHLLERTLTVPTAPQRKSRSPKVIWRTMVEIFGLKYAAMIAGLVTIGLLMFAKVMLTPTTVESVFLGKWQVPIPNTGSVFQPHIKRGGKYQVKTSIKEAGSVIVRDGSVLLKPQEGYERFIEWNPLDASRVQSNLAPQTFWQLNAIGANHESITRLVTLAAKAVWVKKADEKQPGIATWEFQPDIQGHPWKLTFQTGPGPAYRFEAEFTDKGLFRATEGKWTMASESQYLSSGTYQVIDDDTISMASNFGQGIWKRVE